MTTPLRSALLSALVLPIVFIGNNIVLVSSPGAGTFMAITENGLPCRGYHDGGKIRCPKTAATGLPAVIVAPGF